MENGVNYYTKSYLFVWNIHAQHTKLMDKLFKDLIEKTINVHIEDIIIKLSFIEDCPKHIEKVFVKVRGVAGDGDSRMKVG